MEQSLSALSVDPEDIRPVKRLSVPFFKDGLFEDANQITKTMDQWPREQIRNNSWPVYPTSCQTEFCLSYTKHALVLKYYVINDYFKSEDRQINGPVHYDNCVEFFVRFNDEPGYYNIEFNCLGIGKVAYGNSGQDRKFLAKEFVENIKTWAKLNHTTNGFDWEMTLWIPVSIFQYSAVELNSSLKCSGNFYKCGDNLPQPHFLTWNRVEADQPNFHSPDFFGEIIFNSGTAPELKNKTLKNFFFQ